MQPTYQCLQKCGFILLAATSSRLDSINIEDGTLISSWTCPTSLKNPDVKRAPYLGEAGKGETSEPVKYQEAESGFESRPPLKKRRLSSPHDTGGEATARNSKTQETEQPNSVVETEGAPAVIALASTKGGEHVIAVTGEDKSIRVFEHDGRGRLRHISQRVMPKRPCAISLSADESTIICADKFGDVYALPLLFPVPPGDSDAQGDTSQEASLVTRPSKPFVPAGSDLTVHSVSNRRALQNQMGQKHTASNKLEPQFERRLLLGHVSMLTDIVLAEHNGQNYIITADRDEHIRISRGIPQTHIIEGYCLGHREFVSRLCVPVTRPHLLISGGGDDDIYVWNWCLGRLLQQMDLRHQVEEVIQEVSPSPHQNGGLRRSDATPSDPVRIAVSSIQHMRGMPDREDDIIIVTCEGIPAVFNFLIQRNSTVIHYDTLRLDSNPLDVVVDSGAKAMIVSIDGAHEAGSRFQLRGDVDSTAQPLQMFQMTGSGWVRSPFHFNIKSGREATSDGRNNAGDRNLTNLLYPLENLRKTGCEEE